MFTPKTLRRFLESEKFKVETIFTVGGTDIANVLSCFFAAMHSTVTTI